MSVSRNLILESEYLPHSIDLGAREVDRSVRVVVATRYCVLPIEEAGELDGSRRREIDDWLGGRLALFRSWTLPSMVRQKHHPDAWVLLVDRRLRGGVVAQIGAELPEWAFVVPVEPGEASSSALDRHAAMLVGPDATRVVARVDNDDAVAVDFCHGLATWTRLANPGSALLSYPFGVQADADYPYGVWGIANTTTGHFSALVVPPGGRINMALAYMHTEVYRGGLDVPVRQLITTQPMWCEVLHEQNLANHVRPGPQISYESDEYYWQARFGGWE